MIMSNNILDFIKKQGNLFDASKYFGGMGKLRELAKGNNELHSFIENNSKGWLGFKASGNHYEFDFYILDYDVDEVDDDEFNVTLIVDLIVDYQNLNDDELLTIGKWVAEYCEDSSLHSVSTPTYLIDKNSLGFYTVVVKKINGKDVPWVPHQLLDDQDSIVPDKTVEDLIDKSMGNTSLSESLIRIKDLFNKVI